MLNTIEIIAAIILVSFSAGIGGWFFISTHQAFSKFNALDDSVQDKLLHIEYYMAFVRQFTKDELVTISALPTKEIKKFNKINDTAERIKTAREKIQ